MYKDENHYTLYQRGKIWGYYYYDKNGHRLYRSTGRKTKHEAMKVINQRIAEGSLAFGGFGKDPILRDYAADFYVEGKCPILKEKSRAGIKIAKTTIIGYRTHLVNEIIPYFGPFKLKQISDSDIKKYESKLKEERGLQHNTINQIIVPLKAVLDQAVSDRIIDRNPFDFISRMREEESTRKAFTLEQIQQLLSVEWRNRYARVAFELASMTGLRIGEVQALRVRCIDGNMLVVSENYAEKLKTTKETKNYKTRTIPFPDAIREDIDDLVRHKGPDDFIFSSNGKKPVSGETLRRNLEARKLECGIEDEDLTFHSARHFFDSYLYLKAGVEKERIMKVIGHRSDEMFRHYLHVEREDLSSVRDAQNMILENNDDKVDDTHKSNR